MAGTKLAFHFEQAPTREELQAKNSSLARDGWKPASEPRRVEVSFASGRRDWLFSQAYVRPALFPVCERVRSSLPARFVVLAGTLKPCEHFVHFYDNEPLFLDSLEAFVVEGLMAGEGVAVIALPDHRSALEFRLRSHGLDLTALEQDRQLVMLDAQLTLSAFMVNGVPNELLFEHLLGGLISQMRATHRTVRAFGEMVGILWSDGNRAGTLRLEEIWHAYCKREGLVLYCAYPRRAFAGEEESVRRICESHTQLIEA